MGNLTPILIRNDCLHLFKDKKVWKQICEGIFRAASSHDKQIITISSGGAVYANYIESLGYAHADVPRVIVIYGNTWIDISRESYKKVDGFNDNHVKFLEKCIEIMQYDINCLKNNIKKLKQKGKK